MGEAKQFFKDLLSEVFLAFPMEGCAPHEERDRFIDGFLHLIDEAQSWVELRKCLLRQWEDMVLFIEGGGSHRKKVIAEALLFIDGGFRGPLTEKDLLHRLCVGKTWFTQAFRTETGSTFSHYLRRLRVEEACRLLRNTDYPLWQVAIEAGFRTDRTMRRALHEKIGISPREYRCTNCPK